MNQLLTSTVSEGSFSPPKVSSFGSRVGLSSIRAASERIARYVRHTPTLIDNGLSRRFATNVYLKQEVLQPTGAFKVRGAFNKMLSLDPFARSKGVVAVSAGNHAQAVAYAAAKLEIEALIVMPENTPRNYLEQTAGYGARIELVPTFAEGVVRATEHAANGRVLVHPFDDPFVIAGQGTIGLEILEDLPQLTDVIVSIGGGGLAAGVAIAVKSLKPDVRIWGVETVGADSMAASLAAGEVIELPSITSIAYTLGAPRVGQMNFHIARQFLESVTVVEDQDAADEAIHLLENSKILTEPAASCTLAALERLKANFDSASHVALILCGGNIRLDDLLRFRSLTNGGAADGQ